METKWDATLLYWSFFPHKASLACVVWVPWTGRPGALLPVWCGPWLKDIWLDVKDGERNCICASLVLFGFPFIVLAQVVSWPIFELSPTLRMAVSFCSCVSVYQGCQRQRKTSPKWSRKWLGWNHSLNVKIKQAGIFLCFERDF